jgi:hypothetical protein
MALLAELLKNPGKDLHVLDLTSAVDGVWAQEAPGRRRPGRPRKDAHPLSGDAGPMSDARARAQYRQRVEEVRAEIAEAERFNDAGRVASLRVEYEELTRELARAYGRRGPRRAGANSERARVRVRNHMSKAISSLDAAIPALSRHLRGSLRTGTFCSYQPERSVPWTF